MILSGLHMTAPKYMCVSGVQVSTNKGISSIASGGAQPSDPTVEENRKGGIRPFIEGTSEESIKLHYALDSSLRRVECSARRAPPAENTNVHRRPG